MQKITHDCSPALHFDKATHGRAFQKIKLGRYSRELTKIVG